MNSSLVRRLVPLVSAGCLFAAPVAQAAHGSRCPGADTAPTVQNLRQARTATLCLLNAQRGARGLRPLRGNARLAVAAERHSADMAAHHYFAHVAPSGLDPVARLERIGYVSGSGSWTVGENIAWGGGPLASPRAIVKMWMHSPGHRANILQRSFREIGVGVVPSAPDGPGATYTTDFGARG